MAYIIPNSDIQLIRINGLDNRYLHTLYFSNVSARDDFFSNKVGRTFTRHSYQRATIGVIRVKDAYDVLYQYHYMRFRNTPSNETGDIHARSMFWYYAFITDCVYVNESTTEIHYEIDEMVTWMPICTVQPCLVLREHTNNDIPSLNLEAEPFGSEIYDSDLLYTDEHTNTDMSLVLTATNVSFNKLTVYNQNYYTDGFYNPTTILVKPIPQGTDTEIKRQLGEYTEQVFGWIKGFYSDETEEQVVPKGDILSVRMFYTDYANIIDLPDSPSQSEDAQQKHYRQTIVKPFEYDNFVPQNKKMFTYPFSFLVCTSGAGSAQQYKWEYFDGDSANFDSYGCVTGEPIITYIPLDYEGQIENIDQRFAITDFPMCPFSYDAFQAWMASSAPSMARNQRNIEMLGAGVTIATSIVSIATGMYLGLQLPESILMQAASDRMVASVALSKSLSQYEMGTNVIPSTTQIHNSENQARQMQINTGISQLAKLSGIASGAIGMYSAYKNYQYTFANAKYQPRVVVGRSGGSQLFGARLPQTRFYHAHIRDDEAKRVDEQLTMFGYATNRVKSPNLTGRRYWNFVKTQGCTIAGDIPGDSLAAIGNILDSGITFWHGDYIGNYRVGYNGEVITNPIS